MADDRIPFILYGDGPRIPSGLARIARDLMVRLVGAEDELGIRVAQVGVDWPGGWHWQAWDFCGFQPSQTDQGRAALTAVVAQLTQETGQRPIVLMIMDPARCYDLTRWHGYDDADPEDALVQAEFWGYFPVDAHNQLGRFGGPARKAVWSCTRVLAYGRYGAGVLKETLDSVTEEGEVKRPVSYLPHGIETQIFRPSAPLSDADADWLAWAQTVPPTALKIGCVATNQARKDFGLLFTTVAHLKAQGQEIALWLHTDKLTHIWDVGELVLTCGLQKAEVAVSVDEITDPQLAARYAWSDVTIAPGLGEGYGYPIVESLACGTPVVHANYAGGVELIPERRWLVEPTAWRLESLYALLRPVLDPRVVADTALLAWVRAERRTRVAYCAGAVAHLDWRALWPRWRSWIAKGLQARRTTVQPEEVLSGV